MKLPQTACKYQKQAVYEAVLSGICGSKDDKRAGNDRFIDHNLTILRNVPNGTDLRQGVSAAYSNENERADIKTVVLSSLSAVRCRNWEYL